MSFRPFLAISLWVAAASLSLLITQRFGEASVVFPGEPLDPLSRVLGTAKEALGDTLFVKADVYFHGGVRHEDHHDDTAEALEREGVIDEAGEHREHQRRDWIRAINDRIKTREVSHLKKETRKEMLPFFAMATALDPHNTEAVLTTAFWLDNEFGKTEESIQVLQKGISDNPDSWEIENALGRIYFKRKDWLSAERHLRLAAEKLGDTTLEYYARVDLYYHLAESSLAIGSKAAALEAYRMTLPFFDEKTTPFLRSVIQGRIKELSEAQ